MSAWAQKSYANLKVDKKKRELLLKELRQLDKEKITAGIHKEDGRIVVGKNGFKLIDLAVQNEFGNEWNMPRTVTFKSHGKWCRITKGTLIKIKPTHFIGRLIQNLGERNLLVTTIKAELHLVLKQYITAKEGAKNIGQFMRERIRSYIDNKELGSNSPFTIEIKGFDKLLYDEGQLYSKIRYRSKKTSQNG